MKTLLGAMLFAAVTQVQAEAIEADLDGNAGALQASEMRSRPQPSRPVAKVARQPQSTKTVVAVGRQSR